MSSKKFDIHQTFYSEMSDENSQCPAKNWTFAGQNVQRSSNKFRVLCYQSVSYDLQVVAPVRESSAQALGVVMQFMQPDLIKSVSNVLLQLLLHEQWEVRHGGLLAVKYMLAVRKVGL